MTTRFPGSFSRIVETIAAARSASAALDKRSHTWRTTRELPTAANNHFSEITLLSHQDPALASRNGEYDVVRSSGGRSADGLHKEAGGSMSVQVETATASEETIYYAFHPLAGRTVASIDRRVVFGGDVHLTIRLADGALTLTPEWMLRPVAAACEIRLAPRLCVARLRDLRAYLDAILGSDHGHSPLTDGADHAPELPTTGSVRRAAAPATDPERTPPSDGGECASALAEALAQRVSSLIRKRRALSRIEADHLARSSTSASPRSIR